MNAIVARQDAAAQAALSWSITDMERVANAIAQGGLFGSKDPYAVLTLCMLAHAEGKHPALVMQDYHIISGKPAKKAEAMQRDFLSAGGKIDWHKLTDDECEATFSHPMGGTATISWDKSRVKQAQLGSNAMHTKYPRQMLRSRVISEGVRTVFPGATSGLYESGEVADMVGDTATPPTPTAQRQRDLQADKPALPSPSSSRAKAEEWTSGFIAAIGEASDLDALDALFGDGRRKPVLERLKDQHNDLYENVLGASSKRAAEVRGDGESFDADALASTPA